MVPKDSTPEVPAPDFALAPTNSPGKFITCGLMEMRPITPADNTDAKFHNRIYLKSEVVIKGADYGWVIQTGLFTYPAKENGAYKNNLEFTYKIIKLKKDGKDWKVESGLGWDNLWAQTYYNDSYIIAPPTNPDAWFHQRYDDKQKKMVSNSRKYSDTGSFSDKSWAGIGEVDEKEGKDLLRSISIYNNSVDEAELWGSDGNFGLDNAGYKDAHYVYVDGKGWKYVNPGKDIVSILKAWYEPFRNKKIRWSDLNVRCDAWSRMRNGLEGDMKALCYNSSTK